MVFGGRDFGQQDAALRTFNLQLSKHARAAEWREAIKLFRSGTGLQRDVVTFGTVVKAIGKALLWRQVLHWLKYVASSSLAGSTILLNTALSCLSDASRWRSAVEVYARSTKTSVQCDVITGNNLISACHLQWQKCLQQAGKIQQEGIKTDIVTHNVVLASFDGTTWTSAMAWLSNTLEKGLQRTAVTYGTAISVHDVKEDFRTGNRAWERSLLCAEQVRTATLEPSIILGNAAITSCERASRWMWSLTLLSTLSQLLQPNLVSLAALGSACDEATCWKTSLSLMNRVPQWFGAETSSRMRSAATACINTVMSASGKVRHWSRSLQLVEDMVFLRLTPSSTTVTCLLMTAAADAEDVVTGLVKQLCNEVRPDIFHLNALLGSFARRSAWHRALYAASTAAVDAVGARATWAALPSDGWQRAIDAMEYFQISHASVASYTSIIDCCVDVWAVTFQLFSELLLDALVPDVVTSNAILRSCGQGDPARWLNAYQLLQRTQHQDVITYTSILSACAGNWTVVLALLGTMQSKRLQASRLTYLAAMDSFGYARDEDHSRDFSTLATMIRDCRGVLLPWRWQMEPELSWDADIAQRLAV
eukprot:s5124_g2.t3